MLRGVSVNLLQSAATTTMDPALQAARSNSKLTDLETELKAYVEAGITSDNTLVICVTLPLRKGT